MKLWTNTQDVANALAGAAEIKNGRLNITNQADFRKLVKSIAENAIFNDNEMLKNTARSIIWEASIALGCPSASIHNLYMARAENVYKNQTIPAINIRGLTFDVARTIFKTLMKHNSKSAIFEIARSEIGYTFQRPAEYTASVLAAAIAEGYSGPVFLQGDHFQVGLKKWKTDPKAEVDAVNALIREAIEAGFYNIDIDASTLVDLDQPTVVEQQRNNFEVTAELLQTVRECEPAGVTISVGGEIGEVGGKNSTKEELVAYLEGVQQKIRTSGKPITGLSKISVQTGTSHGGVPLPDGTVAKVKLDFNVLSSLGEECRNRFHIGGVVQHGASTLPEEAFDHFPKNQTLEVHLATGFQNVILDSKNFPQDLKAKIYGWLDKNCSDEKKEGQTDEQFYYKTRKKGFGPFKKELWMLSEGVKGSLMDELARVFDMMFTKLGIVGNAELIDKYIKPNPPHKNIYI